MRAYRHRPDEAFAVKSLEQARKGFGQIDRAVAAGRRPGAAVRVDAAVDAASYGWGLGLPVVEVQDYLRRGAEVVREALAQGEPLAFLWAGMWLELAVLSGDRDLVARLSVRIPDELSDTRLSEPSSMGFTVGLARLAEGRREEAAAAARVMAGAQDDPAQSPEGLEAIGGLAGMIATAASGDQAGFERAAAERSAAVAATYGRSVEDRRDRAGLLDLAGAAVLAAAHDLGLAVPPDDPYLATELVDAR